ncbi:hypothetical protein ACET9R_15855 [Aeromonas veronii]
MFENVAALFEIGEKAPPAIDYFYMPPHPQWVPDVALKKTHQNQEFWLAVVGINNLSSKVLPSLRVKLPFAPQYEPTIDISRFSVTQAPKYDAQTYEIYVPRLDPGDHIYIVVFLSKSEALRFSEPQVIIHDRLLSRGMRAVGYFKKRPKEVLLLVVPLILTAVTIAFSGAVIYQSSSLNPKVRAVMQATEGYSGCVPTAYEKAKVNETLLARHRLGELFLLNLNHVVTREDLFDKDYVVICEER